MYGKSLGEKTTGGVTLATSTITSRPAAVLTTQTAT